MRAGIVEEDEACNSLERSAGLASKCQEYPVYLSRGYSTFVEGPALPVETPGTSAAELREVSGVDPTGRKSKGFSIWTLATGIVYGLQPDALFVIIPALALPTKLAAASYMTMFVMGTVLAMGSYTAFIGTHQKPISFIVKHITTSGDITPCKGAQVSFKYN